MVVGNEGNNNLAMSEKGQAKRTLPDHRAGYVPMYKRTLYKTGLRGCKGIIFYGIIVLLFVIALANLALTLMLLGVLRITYGMESMEFIPTGVLLRFLGHSDLGTVIPVTGIVGGFASQSLPIVGEGQSVILQAGNDKPGSRLEVAPEWTIISDVKEFRIRSPSTGRNIFSTKYEDFKLPHGIPHLNVQEAHVSRIASARSDPLAIQSPYQIVLKGNEGLSMDGREVIWVAEMDIYLKSVNQSVVLDGKKGTLVSVDKLPLAAEPRAGAPRWYKVCVCIPSGRVFRVPVRDHGYGCGDIRFPESINPCT